MAKPKVKAIIFDLGGVILHGGYLDFIKHYCHACLTPAGQKRISELERRVNLGDLTEHQFYREIEKVFDVHLTPQEMHNVIVNQMSTDQGLLHLIPKLKKTKIALFTNSINHMAQDVIRLRRIPTKKLFDKVFVSSELHLVKPDRKAYSYVLKKLKVKPVEALMVDDRLENIRGARKLGIQGIVYKNFRQFKRELKKYELWKEN